MIEVRLYLFTFYAAQRKHNGSKFRGLEILVNQNSVISSSSVDLNIYSKLS